MRRPAGRPRPGAVRPLLGVSLLGLLWLAPIAAQAHGRSVSYTTWLLDGGGATVTLRLQAVDATALGLPPSATDPVDLEALLAYAQSHLWLEAQAQPCLPEGPPLALSQSDGVARLEWRVDCPQPQPGQQPPRTVTSRLFAEVLPGHLHFAHFRLAGTAVDAERVLDGREPTATVPEPASAPAAESFLAVAGRHVRLGVEHILSGPDHLLFAALLLLGAASLRQVAWLVTGFTLGHSLTLAAATLGWVRPATGAVDALIGASIAWVALENAWDTEGRRAPWLPAAGVAGLVAIATAAALLGHTSARPILGLALFAGCHSAWAAHQADPQRGRWALAALFGLVHGFGFASVLIDAGLPAEARAGALLGFNLGVELGQLALLALMWPILVRFRRHPPLGGWLRAAGSAVGVGAGTFWLVTRALG